MSMVEMVEVHLEPPAGTAGRGPWGPWAAIRADDGSWRQVRDGDRVPVGVMVRLGGQVHAVDGTQWVRELVPAGELLGEWRPGWAGTGRLRFVPVDD